MGSMDSGIWAPGGSIDVGASLPEEESAAAAAPGMDLMPSQWCPRPLAFKLYSPRPRSRFQARRGSGFRGGVSFGSQAPALVIRLTRDIIMTFQKCNPGFTYSETFNPKRYLTNPCVPMGNNGLDNCNSELILAVNGVLINADANRRYVVKDMLGQGSFGQVAKCWSDDYQGYVAVKVIKNQQAYSNQARVEIGICTMLNRFDPGDQHHIVRIFDHFSFEGHLCLVFELLTVNLFELLKHNYFRGIPLNLLRTFTRQILDALTVLQDASVIHCDLKPENILLSRSLHAAEVKLIDFGSACKEDRTVYSYIQSRFYRSPEVLLGLPYTTAIDMWSLGCIVAELFLGLPLFPGSSEHDVLHRMTEILGCNPPDHLLRSAKHTSKFFKHASCPEGPSPSAFQFLSESEYESREKKKLGSRKWYFQQLGLEQMVVQYPLRKGMTPEEITTETQMRCSLVDFLKGLLEFDPVKRWTPRQALQHPFLTGEPWSAKFTPLPETRRTPVAHGLSVDHNPVAGHWLGMGLSPQLQLLNAGPQFASPRYQASLSHASSFGSGGSYGSYDHGAPGSSYGSLSDKSGIFPNYPTPPVAVIPAESGSTFLGTSPDAWGRTGPGSVSGIPLFGHSQLGFSANSGSGFRPMSLGASPSQPFTPPASQLGSPASPSHISPGRYGPTSPARSNAGTSSLGKGKGVGKQFHMLRSSSSSQNSGQDYRQRQQGNGSGPSESGPCSCSDVGARSGSHYRGSPAQNCSYAPPRRYNRGVGHLSNPGALHPPQSNSSYAPGTLGSLLASPDRGSEGGEDTSPPPDPGDWEPDYSDELLLSESADGCTTSSGFSLSGVMGSGGARLGPGPGLFPGPGPGRVSAEMYWPALQRLLVQPDPMFAPAGKAEQHLLSVRPPDGSPGAQFLMNGHVYQQGALGGTNNIPRSSSLHQVMPLSMDSSLPLQHGMQSGFGRNMPKQQSSPSRLGQHRPHQVAVQIPVSPENPHHFGDGRSVLSDNVFLGSPGHSLVYCSQGYPAAGLSVANGIHSPQGLPSNSPPSGRNGPHPSWPLPPPPTGRRGEYRR